MRRWNFAIAWLSTPANPTGCPAKPSGSTPVERVLILLGNPNRRILRGGSWSSLPEHCRSGFRYCYNPATRSYFLGFRVVYATAPT
ncbi:MAG: SUMF1/EgtB/PvdO family nonheme iron enzyme [Nodosilinea sp.]